VKCFDVILLRDSLNAIGGGSMNV